MVEVWKGVGSEDRTKVRPFRIRATRLCTRGAPEQAKHAALVLSATEHLSRKRLLFSTCLIYLFCRRWQCISSSSRRCRVGVLATIVNAQASGTAPMKPQLGLWHELVTEGLPEFWAFDLMASKSFSMMELTRRDQLAQSKRANAAVLFHAPFSSGNLICFIYIFQ